jgi:hypothetical protein
MDENEMVNFLKTIADADRLRIVGLLTHTSARLSEIVNALGFHPADAQHHLNLLVESGVVRLSDGLYELDTKALEKLTRQQFKGGSPAYAPEPSLEKDKKRVLAAHLNADGTIKIIPLQSAKLHVILDYLINAFSVGMNYSEKEVNLILVHFHPDTSGLRRDLVEAGLLERERDGSRYWRPK